MQIDTLPSAPTELMLCTREKLPCIYSPPCTNMEMDTLIVGIEQEAKQTDSKQKQGRLPRAKIVLQECGAITGWAIVTIFMVRLHSIPN